MNYDAFRKFPGRVNFLILPIRRSGLSFFDRAPDWWFGGCGLGELVVLRQRAALLIGNLIGRLWRGLVLGGASGQQQERQQNGAGNGQLNCKRGSTCSFEQQVQASGDDPWIRA